MTLAGAQGERKRPRPGTGSVGGEVSDVEPPGLADPMGFVKEKEELSDVRVLLGGARSMKWGEWRQEKRVCREGRMKGWVLSCAGGYWVAAKAAWGLTSREVVPGAVRAVGTACGAQAHRGSRWS